jgi:hypothetical protein
MRQPSGLKAPEVHASDAAQHRYVVTGWHDAGAPLLYPKLNTQNRQVIPFA